ncbi:MAG: hypothetical protein GWP19_13190 [Planctomycetia bacterium]|nr:hypothetical protein [Planctomycetia bacterium]
MQKSFIIVSIFILFGCANTSDRKNEISESPINLSHTLSLVDSMLVEDEMIAYIWIYSDAPDYVPIEAPQEGITCVDDVGRFLEIIEYEILVYKQSDLIPLARKLTKFLLYMGLEDGLWNNFIYADGTRNANHQNSEAEFGWWAIRGLRGLAAAYKIFENSDIDSKLVQRINKQIEAANVHIQDALSNYPLTNLTYLGMKPAWLVKNAPDMNSELIISLVKLHNTGKFDYYNVIEKIAKGLVDYQYRNTGHDLDGMFLCWNNTWHNWGNNQAYALLEAYKITGDSTSLSSVIAWADSFVPFLDSIGFPNKITVDYNGNYTTETYPQIAYGFNSLYHGMKTLANITNEQKYEFAAENIFAWFIGKNKAGISMYDLETGRCYDGIDGESSINMNSGAESTIECLSAIQMRGEL